MKVSEKGSHGLINDRQKMKRLSNVWEQLCDETTLLQAIITASKGKRKYSHVRQILKKPEQYAHELSLMLKEGRFKPSEYKVDLMKTEYGKVREIFKLPFYPDRCVQHAISAVLRHKWDRSLTNDTYACLVGRGINSGILRYNLNHKVKRAIQSYRHRQVYILKMDISKCYPSVDNELLAKAYRRHCKDEKALKLLDDINFNGKGLPIGNFLSQIEINLYLGPLDRFVKEELKVKHYFRYMDDLVLMSEDKPQLHQWEWRILNFLWYELHLESNRKRQIFPLGRTKAERGLDFGGYVFYYDFTMVRKRIKKAFAKRRHKPLSVPSYMGILTHCDARNLIDKIVNRDNDMDLSQALGRKIERPFEGDKIKIDQVVDREIEILNYDVRESKQKPGTKCVVMQIRFEGKKRVIMGGYQFLCQVLELIDKSQLPLQTIIRNKRGYIFEGTVNDE